MGVVPRATVVGVVVRNVVSASFRNPFTVVVKRRDNCHAARRAVMSVVYHRALIDHLRDQDLGRGGAAESGTYKWLFDSVTCRSPGDAEWERAHPYILTGSNVRPITPSRTDFDQVHGVLFPNPFPSDR